MLSNWEFWDLVLLKDLEDNKTQLNFLDLIKKLACPTPNTAQAQVTAALSRVGKSASELKTTVPKKIENIPKKSPPNHVSPAKPRATLPVPAQTETPQSNRFENRKIDKNTSLLELAKKSKVNKLIR